MLIEKFGVTMLNEPVKLYTLENQNGVRLKVMNIGATMVSLFVKDKMGKMRDVILGCDNVAEYQKQTNCFGATVGRNANRIASAKCVIDGQTYQLEQNDNRNNLHSGKNGFHNMIWDAKVEEDRNDTITFTYYSKDLEQGFPGNMTAKVTYSLTENDELKIDFLEKPIKLHSQTLPIILIIILVDMILGLLKDINFVFTRRNIRRLVVQRQFLQVLSKR